MDKVLYVSDLDGALLRSNEKIDVVRSVSLWMIPRR